MSYPHQGTAALGSNPSYPQVKRDLSTDLSTGGPGSSAVKVTVATQAQNRAKLRKITINYCYVTF